MAVSSRKIGRPKGTGSQRVYTNIRDRILRLELDPGTALEEMQIVREFGISRTPVREALIRLASEGYVNLIPNKTPRVAPLDIQEVPEFFEALELCARISVRFAAVRRTERDIEAMRGFSDQFANAIADDDFHRMTEANRHFHLAIARCCGNRYIADLYETLLFKSLRFAFAVGYDPFLGRSKKRHYAKVIRDHEKLIRLIANGDADAADTVARSHSLDFMTRVMEHLQDSLAGSVPLATLDA